MAPGRARQDTSGRGQDIDEVDAPEPAPQRAQVRVLGHPDILGRPPQETMRSYCTDVMVYLAAHADGASADQILEDLWPEERRRVTAIRLHTGLSNLRTLLAKSVGAATGGFVLRQRGRYRLNPDLLDVDLWRLKAGHLAARVHAGTDEAARISALRQACDAYTGPLHDGRDSAWIEPYREGARAMAIDVHTALAAALADTDHVKAAQLLDTAITHDPANEQVYQQAMRAHHHLGDADTIRSLVRQLTLALSELDVQPSEDTLDLAGRLRRDLEVRRRPAA
jgi:DNA-binding SARP family transcriptional activator